LLNNKLEHVAFILDGNKRWAKKNNISIKEAYREGLNNITKLINHSLKLKLKYLTLFTLSSENIYRSSINNIYQIIYDDFAFFFEKIIKEKKVSIKIIGSKENIPIKIIELINYCEDKTKENNFLYLNLAFNYGFKDEIRQVFNKILNNKNLKLNNEIDIKKLFLLGNIPDPDLLIRTGGEKRLSNFIMYNLTYTEIFFINDLWPEFDNKKFLKIIDEYKTITRRYGL
tara:strand:+ start:4199 stop:4882 length:684 start_codon:yes stop_codon:yes gene_type:complete